MGEKVVRKLSPWGYVRKRDLVLHGRKQIACVNGGTCKVVNDDTYECECDPGYSGDHCENSKTETTISYYQFLYYYTL